MWQKTLLKKMQVQQVWQKTLLKKNASATVVAKNTRKFIHKVLPHFCQKCDARTGLNQQKYPLIRPNRRFSAV